MGKVVRVLAWCWRMAWRPPVMAAPRRAEVAQVTQAQQARKLTAAQAAEYQAREAAAPGLEKFKGGGGVDIYIGGTALAIALLVVLLVCCSDQ
jgi:hypothetical protein